MENLIGNYDLIFKMEWMSHTLAHDIMLLDNSTVVLYSL